MSLAQYRASVKILGEKSALFQHKKEILEGLGMGLSHEQIHYFLTSQKGLKISRQALSTWLKKHKNTNQKATIFEPSQNQRQKQANTTVTQKNEVINQPKGEPTTHLKVDDRASKVKAEIAKTDSKISLDGIPDGLFEYFAHTIK